MSLLINGMEMPTVGRILITLPSGRTLEVSADNTQNILGEAKAVPVPPQGDLIGRNWLIDIALHLMDTAKNDDIYNGVKWLLQYVIDAPTVIPASDKDIDVPIRKEGET